MLDPEGRRRDEPRVLRRQRRPDRRGHLRVRSRPDRRLGDRRTRLLRPGDADRGRHLVPARARHPRCVQARDEPRRAEPLRRRSRDLDHRLPDDVLARPQQRPPDRTEQLLRQRRRCQLRRGVRARVRRSAPPSRPTATRSTSRRSPPAAARSPRSRAIRRAAVRRCPTWTASARPPSRARTPPRAAASAALGATERGRRRSRRRARRDHHRRAERRAGHAVARGRADLFPGVRDDDRRRRRDRRGGVSRAATPTATRSRSRSPSRRSTGSPPPRPAGSRTRPTPGSWAPTASRLRPATDRCPRHRHRRR